MGIDAPLSVIRMEYSDTLSGPTRVIPLANWKGQYDSGIIGGRCHYLYFNRELKPESTGSTYEEEPDPNQIPQEGYSEHCVEVDWPAQRLWSSYARRTTWEGHISWMGSLIQHGRDESGQLYRRNRYYDPSSGRFTPEDPIGIAGGLNVYGYASGDPVHYSDPYGLSCEPMPECLGGFGSLVGLWEDFKAGAPQTWEDTKEFVSEAPGRTRLYVRGGAGMFSTQGEIDGEGRPALRAGGTVSTNTVSAQAGVSFDLNERPRIRSQSPGLPVQSPIGARKREPHRDNCRHLGRRTCTSNRCRGDWRQLETPLCG